ELARRLAERSVGAILRTAEAAQLDAAVENLTRNFERFGDDARAYFQQRAKAFSITVAVAVAFALNIDAVRLFTTLLVTPEMTAQLIEYGKALPRQTPPAAQAPPRTPEAAPAPAGDALAPGQANASAPAASDPAPDPAANLQKTVNEARDNVATAMAFHLPIGLAYFPWCQSNHVDQTCATYGVALRHKYYRLAATLWVRWFLFTVLSGLLI